MPQRRRGRRARHADAWPTGCDAGSPRCARSSARCGRTSWSASPWAPGSTATCPRTSWPASWARTSGGRCPPPSLIGVPMYSNAAGIIPVVEALLAKGAALGTVLAFMMSVIALSLPEMIILRKVLQGAAHRDLRRRRGDRDPAGGLRVQRGAVGGGRCHEGHPGARDGLLQVQAHAHGHRGGRARTACRSQKVEDLREIMKFSV